jgi:hypothetical protein
MAQPSLQTTRDLTHISEQAWSKACKRLTAIQPLLTAEPVSKEVANDTRKALAFTYPPCIDGWKRIAKPNNLGVVATSNRYSVNGIPVDIPSS